MTKLGLGIGVMLAIVGQSAAALAAPLDVAVPLDGKGFAMELAEARRRLYVSIPSRNEVAVVSTRRSR